MPRLPRCDEEQLLPGDHSTLPGCHTLCVLHTSTMVVAPGVMFRMNMNA